MFVNSSGGPFYVELGIIVFIFFWPYGAYLNSNLRARQLTLRSLKSKLKKWASYLASLCS